MVKKVDIGTALEQAVRDVFEELSARFKFTYIRLYDRKSAQGRYIPEQPGDYLAAAKGQCHLVELKASEKHSSLRSCLSDNVSDFQGAAHRLWNRAGSPSCFIFHSVNTFELEIWDGLVVGECKAFGKVLPKVGEEGGPLVVGYDTLREALYTAFVK